MDDFLDPQFMQSNGLDTNVDDLFDVDIKPKGDREQLTVEIPEKQDEEMEDLFGDDDVAEEPTKER